jgi:hypothetical protein
MFEDGRYRWRETYFVLFRAADRPKLKKVERALAALDERYELHNARADDQGRFESLTLVSPDDYAALDICFLEGEEVREQVGELAKEIKPADLSPAGQKAHAQLAQCDARYDVLHFEQVTGDDDEDDEMLDPGSLFLVLGELAKLCRGVAVDPQSGTILDSDE